MRISSLVFLMMAALFVVKAQTNTATPVVGTNATPLAARSNAPTELRPTEIQSKSCQFFMKSNVYVYRENVRIDNPQMKLACELLTVEAPKMTNGNRFNRATAVTNVVIDWVDENGTNHATSDMAVYTYVISNLTDGQALPHFETNATVVLTGSPVVTNRMGTWEGDPLNWDRINGVITSPNMKRMTINQGETNTSSLFEPPAPKPSKTNSTSK
jgi:lipopolysaccharide export system protein LptA